MWVRGLKHFSYSVTPAESYVAPHVGAWIETVYQECDKQHTNVAPHVGAWIETEALLRVTSVSLVAPHVGAWIETCQSRCFCASFASHPM